MTVTIHAWYVYLWLAAGVVLFVPLNFLAHRHIHNGGPFWPSLWGSLVRAGWTRAPMYVLLQVFFWPWAVWEVLR